MDKGRATRVAIVGETYDQAREVMIFGDSGIMACSPPDRRPTWIAGRKMLQWPNGAIAQVFSAFDPESLRGPQFDAVWADEVAKWKKGQETWDMIQFGLRLGDDLRCGSCRIGPRAETLGPDPIDMPWQVSGADRATAGLVPYADDRPVYGGTPTDQSVVQAIQSLTARGISPVFYPFVLMEQMSDNTLPDPWGSTTQPALPWRGRITLSLAPTQSGTPDKTALAEAEVTAFFGTAQASDFAINGTSVTYTGPTEWSYRRFILHYAHLCAAAGGVGVFCIGSELRGLTEIRGANGFPAVDQLR